MPAFAIVPIKVNQHHKQVIVVATKDDNEVNMLNLYDLDGNDMASIETSDRWIEIVSCH